MSTRTAEAVVTNDGVLAPVAKFSRPGVPPTCRLARQFSGGTLGERGLILASDAPLPSAATGQGCWSRQVISSMRRSLLLRRTRRSPALLRVPLHGPSVPAPNMAGVAAMSRYLPAEMIVFDGNV